MNAALPRARLYLIGAAALVFLGGLLIAIGRWNAAETDRAFVEAAALAVRAPPAPGGVRYWAPAVDAAPGTVGRIGIEAAERLRQAAAAAARATAPLPAEKPPAAPR